MQQQVAKICSIQFAQTSLILPVELNALVIISARLRGWNLPRRPSSVFPAVNDARQLPCRPAFVVNLRRGDQLLHQPQLIVAVQNGEIAFQPRQFRMTA